MIYSSVEIYAILPAESLIFIKPAESSSQLSDCLQYQRLPVVADDWRQTHTKGAQKSI